MSNDIIQSTAEGMSWQTGTNKDRSGRVYAYAMEGKHSQGNGFSSFEIDLFGSRQVRYTTEHRRATAKAKADALNGLYRELREQGLIA